MVFAGLPGRVQHEVLASANQREDIGEIQPLQRKNAVVVCGTTGRRC